MHPLLSPSRIGHALLALALGILGGVVTNHILPKLYTAQTNIEIAADARSQFRLEQIQGGGADDDLGAAAHVETVDDDLRHCFGLTPPDDVRSVHGMDLLSRISIDPAVRFGKPCVRGTRLSVGDVLGYLAAGMSEVAILADFPQLTREDIRACLAFAAERERCIMPVPAA